MKIQIHSMTLDGKPIPDDGRILQSPTCLEAAEQMHHQTPFTADMTLREYQLGVLSNIDGDKGKPLPDDPEQAAVEFFTRMAQHGWVEFLPEDVFIISPYSNSQLANQKPDQQKPNNGSEATCADK